MGEIVQDAGGAGRTVVVEPGLPIEDAAAWVGHACWAELRFHELLTTWMADETDDATSAELWSIRAACAERATDWHRRLPELREMPRPDFMVPSSPEVAAFFDSLATATASGELNRLLAAEVVAGALRVGYEQHWHRAVGTADGPVARTIAASVASLSSTPTPGDADSEVPPLP